MKKSTSMAIAALFSVCFSNANAAETYVYCAEADGSWDWLIDSSQDYVNVEGVWGREPVPNLAGSYFNYFRISEAAYHSLSHQCGEGKNAQPGGHNSSYWEVFKVSRNNGEDYLASGNKTILGSYANHYFRSL
ncbi:hypothetical protein HQQ94_10960 [Shewanella sp. VB17]|uniref:hypothetical protein n=1 Tax=Shewanella sp. VB17 TaxID=2739432 RepID=UPI001563D895|nr:hypothetical protein [Shewanella sp. VB17]NRD73752.1 hypothetical protein [Shewanella sp. VB17]